MGKGQEMQGQAALPLCGSKKNPHVFPSKQLLGPRVKEGNVWGI